ncbi:tetratricopeptide repeat protein [Massilia sp. Se16.2.3]
MAEACERSGDQAGAIRHYRRALELAPGSANARKRLEALGGAAPGKAS